MWVAKYESTNFSFEAYGETELKARKALISGLKRHAEQYNCEPDWYCREDIWAYEVTAGSVLRDCEELSKPRDAEIGECMDLLRRVYDEWVIHVYEENANRKACKQVKKTLDWVESTLKERT